MQRNMFIIKCICLLLLASWSLQAGAQNTANNFNAYMPQMPYLTPEAASLGKYGEIPVSEYTGVPEISIPLYTVQDGELSLPLSLTYHASGIKVAQEATWVGLGWDLQAGGCINRVVSGSYDKEYTVNTAWADWEKFFSQDNMPFVTFGDNSVWGGVQENPNTIYYKPSLYQDLSWGMGEPDIFQVYVCGHSFAFILHPNTGEPMLVGNNCRGYRVEAMDSYDSSWKITDTEGIQYLFEQDGAEEMTGSGLNYITSWFLTAVVHPQKGRIDLEYETEGSLLMRLQPSLYQENVEAEYVSTIVTSGSGTSAGWPSTELLGVHSPLLYENSMVQKKYLKSIKAGLARVDFYKSSRQDIEGYSRKLDSIVVYNTYAAEEAVRHIAFSYDYYQYTNKGGDYMNDKGHVPANDYRRKRLKLESVSVNDEVYSFEYDNTPLPYKTSYAADFWGYYNGRENRSFLCASNKMRIHGRGMTKGLGDANRYADPDYAKAGMLTKITYPTKGYTMLEYELNDFVDNVTWYPLAEDMYVGEEQATAINAFDCHTSDDYRSKDFTLEEAKEVTVSFAVVSPYFYLSSCSSAYAKITRTDGGNFFKYYQIPHQMVNEKTHSYTFTEKLTLEAGDYNVTCFFPPEVHGQLEGCESLTNITIIYYSEPDIAERYDGISYGGGLRIASMEQHDADGSLLRKLDYDYTNEDGTSSGKLLLPVPEEQTDTWYVGTLSPALDQFNKYILTSGAKIPAITSLHGTPVGYSRVTVKDSKEGVDNGKTVTTYHNTPALHYFYDTYLFINYLNGKPIERLQVSADGKNVQKQKWEYTLKNTASVMLNAFATDLAQGSANHSAFLGTKRYRIQAYPFYQEWSAVSEEQVIEYNSDGTPTVTRCTQYEYDAEGKQPTAITQSTSGGGTQKTTISYADAFKGTGVYDRMCSLNMLDYPVETVEQQDGETVLKSKNEYALFDNVPRLGSIRQAKGNGSYETRMQYTRYDSDGNLLELVRPDQVTVSYLWSYKNYYPVAQVEGMAYDDVVNALTPSYVSSINNGIEGVTQLRNIQGQLGQGIVTAWSYRPLIGIQGAVDPDGNTYLHIYDDAGRLTQVRDTAGKTLERYEYNYRE